MVVIAIGITGFLALAAIAWLMEKLTPKPQPRQFLMLPAPKPEPPPPPPRKPTAGEIAVQEVSEDAEALRTLYYSEMAIKAKLPPEVLEHRIGNQTIKQVITNRLWMKQTQIITRGK